MKRTPFIALLPLLACACVDTTAMPEDEVDDAPEGLSVVIQPEQDVHPISPLIYGVNPHSGHRCDDANLRYGSCRLGGNRWTAYNWENNLSNAGRDYCFQNDEHLGSMDDPAGSAATYVLSEATAVDAVSILTVPIVDLVAGEPTGAEGPPACAGDVRNVPDFETAVMRKNAPLSDAPDLSDGPDLSDDTVYQDQFVAHVRDLAEGMNATVAFSLDNEPDLWPDTHPEVYPERVTYTDLVKRNTDYALAIKNTWPEADVVGFASYGYQGFTSLQDAPDADEHGRFIDYYLRSMKEAEEQHGQRLIDYVDVHWYPEISVPDEQGQSRRLTEAHSFPEMVEQRVQAARSLWDKNYVESSWVASISGAVRLIPWLQDIVDEEYPGTKLAIGEYYYGGGNHISGGIAHADAFGAFGREGLGMATLWPHTGDDAFVRAAFRVYRNYDGEGAEFGSTSVAARTNEDDVLAVYSSLNDDGMLVTVLINRTEEDEDVDIEVDADDSYTPGRVFVMLPDAPELVDGEEVSRSGANRFEYRAPAMSVSVIELEP